MVRRILLTLTCVTVLGAVCIAATPGPHGGGFAHTPLGKLISGNIGRLMVLRSELDLTKEQRDQVRQVLGSHRPQIAATAKTVHDARVALRDAVLNEQGNEAEIRQAADRLGDAISDAAVKAAKLRAEIAPILTDQQKALIGKYLAEKDASIDKFLSKAIEEK